MADRHSHFSKPASNDTRFFHNPIPKAKVNSLPYSLRHLTPDDAMRDAYRPLSLLDERVYRSDLATEAHCGLNMTQKVAGGLALVLNLLRDKLNIAWESYLAEMRHE